MTNTVTKLGTAMPRQFPRVWRSDRACRYGIPKLALPSAFALILILIASPVLAATPAIEAMTFPEGRVVETVQLDPEEETRVITSQVSEVRDRLRFSDALTVPGAGQRRLLELPSTYTPEAVLDHYQTELEERDGRILFDCDGRACGRSATWANRVFNQSRLYGQDGGQVYIVGLWRDDQNRMRLLSVYAVRRGNRSISVLEQYLEIPEDYQLPGSVPRERQVLGPFVIPFEPGAVPRLQLDPAIGSDISKLARRYPDAHVYVAGFAPASLGGPEEAMAQSRLAIGASTELLEDNGVPAERQIAIEVGAAIPITDPERQGPRVEVTVVRKDLETDE